MKTISCLDDCLDYVLHLGLVKVEKSPGWIPAWQWNACELCDKMLFLSGQKTWFHKEFIPFGVECERATGRIKVQYPNSSTIAGFVHSDT